MTTILVHGGAPLTGSVKTSGAKNAALKLIHAAMFSNEDVVLSNVPHIKNIDVDLEIIKSVGGEFEWVGENKLRLNGAGINSYEIPYDLGSKYRTAGLLVAPLVYRFGKAVLPLPGGCKIGYRPINRWIESWKSLGINVKEDERNVYLEAETLEGGNINFKINTVMGTEVAILSALFTEGETVLTGAAEEPEIDDLIEFCNLMGADVTRDDHRIIKVVGKNVFRGNSFTIQPDRIEVVTLAAAALVTGGNINIVGVEKSSLLAFVNVLTKIGAQYEFSGDEMRVWHTGEPLKSTTIATAPAPGFMTDWQPLITVLLTQADGESLVHDTVYTDRFGYTKDLNRMGAKIELIRPSDIGMEAVVSDDYYDIKKLGEPKTVAKIVGPSKLKGEKIIVPDLRAGAALILAALAAEGKSEISGYEHVLRGYENFTEKLVSLGANIKVVSK